MVARNVNFSTLSGNTGRAPVPSNPDNCDSIALSNGANTMSKRNTQAAAEQAEQSATETRNTATWQQIDNSLRGLIRLAGDKQASHNAMDLATKGIKVQVREYIASRPPVQELADNLQSLINGGGPYSVAAIGDSKAKKSAYNSLRRYFTDSDLMSLEPAPDAEHGDRYVVKFGKASDGVRALEVSFQTARIVAAEAKAESVKAQAELEAKRIREEAEAAQKQAEYLSRPVAELVAELEAYVMAQFGERASEVVQAFIDSRTESNANAA